MMPLPQRGSVQVHSQPSPLIALPSSHCSPRSTMPLPQVGSVQFASQPSPLIALPSSHCSPASTMLFPQMAGGVHENWPMIGMENVCPQGQLASSEDVSGQLGSGVGEE